MIFPDMVVGLIEVGDPPRLSHFTSGGEFCWVADKPYRVSENRYVKFVPDELQPPHPSHTICLFVRPEKTEVYRYVGKLEPAGRFKIEGGKNHGEAYFSISPILPSEVWSAIDGFDPGDLDHDALDRAMERLGEPTNVEDRLDVLRRVFAYWHGPISPEDSLPERDLDGLRIPASLRWWYLWAGRRTEILSGQNTLLDPDELMTKEDLLVFYGENQWCYEWATLFEGDDPPVFGRSEETDPWQPEGVTLSEHLILACLFEATMCLSPYGASASWLEKSVLEKLAEQIPPIAINPWRWGGSVRFYARNGAFMLAMPNGEIDGEQGYSIWIGAKTEEPLQVLKPFINDRWDHVAI